MFRYLFAFNRIILRPSPVEFFKNIFNQTLPTISITKNNLKFMERTILYISILFFPQIFCLQLDHLDQKKQKPKTRHIKDIKTIQSVNFFIDSFKIYPSLIDRTQYMLAIIQYSIYIDELTFA